ncbi:sigma-54 dependent transcriptional regulator [Puniceicoccaceae bacterium K14]|nr:sigma-54 dependent transcriptional regulator [Puniceicoccaceae bacterium K14]
MRKKRISNLLIADDDAVIRKLVHYNFEKAGLYCDVFEDGHDLLKVASEETHVCVLDIEMPRLGGLECLKKLKKTYPHIEVVILTNVNQAAEALEAIRSGAFDYLTKPFDPNTLIRAVRKAIQLSKKQRENDDLRSTLVDSPVVSNALGESDAMARIKNLLSRIAPSDNVALFTGPSGTGKTLLARELHSKSKRANGPFISVSCPSLPGELLESEMFGHEKGSFSGATQRRLGRAELAHSGTLFLDEIGEMSLPLQAKLLTFLQEKTFYRLGGEKQIQSDIRIVAATNQDLEKSVREGKFREDLYFRLNVLPIHVPTLSERKADIRLLLDHFLSRIATSEGQSTPIVLEETYVALENYSWPGNIRELENAVIQAYTLRLDTDTLQSSDFTMLRKESANPESSQTSTTVTKANYLSGLPLAEIEKLAITQTLEMCHNNKSETARILGIAEKSIYNKMKKHGIVIPKA